MRTLVGVIRLLAFLSISSAAKLTQVTSGWDNPTKLSFYIYVPDKLAAQPPVIIVVSVHDIPEPG
jgi:acetylxylan esterase